MRCPPAAVAAPDGARPPASPDLLTYPSITPGHPFDPGDQSTAVPPVNTHPQCHPAPRRCGEYLPEDQQRSRFKGRHKIATPENPNDGDNGDETARGCKPSGENVGIETGWQPGLSSIHPRDRRELLEMRSDFECQQFPHCRAGASEQSAQRHGNGAFVEVDGS